MTAAPWASAEAAHETLPLVVGGMPKSALGIDVPPCCDARRRPSEQTIRADVAEARPRQAHEEADHDAWEDLVRGQQEEEQEAEAAVGGRGIADGVQPAKIVIASLLDQANASREFKGHLEGPTLRAGSCGCP